MDGDCVDFDEELVVFERGANGRGDVEVGGVLVEDVKGAEVFWDVC